MSKSDVFFEVYDAGYGAGYEYDGQNLPISELPEHWQDWLLGFADGLEDSVRQKETERWTGTVTS